MGQARRLSRHRLRCPTFRCRPSGRQSPRPTSRRLPWPQCLRLSPWRHRSRLCGPACPSKDRRRPDRLPPWLHCPVSSAVRLRLALLLPWCRPTPRCRHPYRQIGLSMLRFLQWPGLRRSRRMQRFRRKPWPMSFARARPARVLWPARPIRWPWSQRNPPRISGPRMSATWPSRRSDGRCGAPSRRHRLPLSAPLLRPPSDFREVSSARSEPALPEAAIDRLSCRRRAEADDHCRPRARR